MGQVARVVAPGMPHHVTQRGNRRLLTFFRHEDYGAYIDLMAQRRRKLHVEIWAHCLMPKHVHFVAVPAVISRLILGTPYLIDKQMEDFISRLEEEPAKVLYRWKPGPKGIAKGN